MVENDDKGTTEALAKPQVREVRKEPRVKKTTAKDSANELREKPKVRKVVMAKPSKEAQLAKLSKVSEDWKSGGYSQEEVGFVDFRATEAMTRDLLDAARGMARDEAEFLVKQYYSMQGSRIRSGNQLRELREEQEPSRIFLWVVDQTAHLEKQVKRGLQAYAESNPVGIWALSQTGIGPVLAAACLAYIKVEKAPNVGHVFSYGGVVPGQKWEKGQKRPWDAGFKNIIWKIGESFKKVSGNDDAYYGKYYAYRRKKIEEANERGDFADVARMTLEGRTFKKKGTVTEDAYKEGKLPVGRIGLRAMRYASKLFISHFFEAAYFVHYGRLPAGPYAIEHLGHKDYYMPPNAILVPGFQEALLKERQIVAPFWM